jgi:serine protease Do
MLRVFHLPHKHTSLDLFSAIFIALLGFLSFYSQHIQAGAAVQQQASLGTGFLVSADGYVVTALHVIRNKERVYVGPITANKWKKAKIIKLDEKNDLALLKISIASSAPLEFAEWADVPIGLEAYSIGYPIPKLLGLSRKMTQGLVNGDRTESGDEGFFQFSAEIQKGNSGGPVFSPDGLVIGVVQKKLNALKIAERSKDLPENVNYAIKSAAVIKFLEGTGVNVGVRKLNLNTNMRPYELYRQKHEAVLAVLAKNDPETSRLDLTTPEVVE